jgi:hypothetical protein
MNELVERRAARAGTDSAVARTTVNTIPDFQRKEGPADKVQSLIGTIAGAENAVAASGSGMGRGLIGLDRRQTAPGSDTREIRTAKRFRSVLDSVEPIGWA